MPLTLNWTDIVLRLAFAFFVGVLFGLDRGEHGKPAGLRTTVLVCLAAASATILANLLISTRGKPVDSFIQLDPMRLPLGVLTGMGFIGAGAILRRGEMIVGVTTAATIWFVTMIGLALGAGQFGLGGIATGGGLLALLGLRWIENRIKQERRGRLIVRCDVTQGGRVAESQIRQIVLAAKWRVDSCDVHYAAEGSPQMIHYHVRWNARRDDTKPPEFLGQITSLPGVRSVRWHG